jgi:carboxypeptidase C (cathepsin A)
MRSMILTLGLAAILALSLGSGAMADDSGKDAAPPKAADKDDAKFLKDLVPYPADASIKQSIKTPRGVLNYTVTVGSLPIRDEKGRKTAEVVFTAYVLDGPHPEARPITFAFNGGPGAASAFLNLGALGPKHVPFGAQGDTPSTPAVLQDNPDTWLDMTDLVFIDPVGTGFSRALVTEDEAKKQFFTMKTDISYLSRIIYDWLAKNGRLSSNKYLVGESYGGFRAPRIAHYLQTTQGVGINGIVMLSPYLDAGLTGDDDTSPMGWVVRMPSMAAAKLERDGRLSPATLQPVIDYAKGEFIRDYLAGPKDQAATARIEAKMTDLFGVDPSLARTMGGRVDTQTLLRELYRREGKVGSRYDINVTTYDPYPFSYEARTGGERDPILDATMAPTTSAMVDFDTRIVGWKYSASAYEVLSNKVNSSWSYEDATVESVTDLRQALAADPRMRVLIAHGYTDLSCPFMASQLIIDQIPNMGDPTRLKLGLYPGGHMFYSRPDSRAALHHDAASVYGLSQ